MSSLSMSGHIDSVFYSIPVELLIKTSGGYVDGLWVAGSSRSVPYVANVQPLRDRELENLKMGSQRILDSRKVYINSGDLRSLRLGDDMRIAGQEWKIASRDVREWRDYAKIVVVRYDDQ